MSKKDNNNFERNEEEGKEVRAAKKGDLTETRDREREREERRGRIPTKAKNIPRRNIEIHSELCIGRSGSRLSI